MNTKKIKLLYICLLIMSYMQIQTQDNQPAQVQNNPNNPIDLIQPAQVQNNPEGSTEVTYLHLVPSAIILPSIIYYVTYCIYNYSIKEDSLVQNKYPQAQAWYQAMSIKYPQAHLNEKQFLQQMTFSPQNFTSWRSTQNQIYFPQESLKDINYLYQKSLDNVELTEEENILMGMQEFILLYEAGHIEHQDLMWYLLSNITLILSVANAPFLYQDLVDNNFNPMSLWPLTFLISQVALVNVSRTQERSANQFAFEQADDNALRGGISFFEDKDRDSLHDVENSKLSPFIQTDSIIGTSLQIGSDIVRTPFFYINKCIKMLFQSTHGSRWLYDLYAHPSRPGCSTQAQKIKDEIIRRAQTKK